MATKIVLVALTREKHQKDRKVKVLTDVTIQIPGKRTIAFKTLAGRWTPRLALQEFKKNPGKFDPQPGFDTVSVEALARIAA